VQRPGVEVLTNVVVSPSSARLRAAGRQLSLLLTSSVVLAACGEEAGISAVARLESPLSHEMLTVTVRDVGRIIRWTGDDFTIGPDNPTPSTPEVETRTSGPDLEVTYVINDGGAVLSSGTVLLPRRSDWRWGVTIEAATANPAEFCFGCVGSRAFGLAEAFRTPGRDSIWVVWGGNSIEDPAIY
jgi:hypothetical protein